MSKSWLGGAKPLTFFKLATRIEVQEGAAQGKKKKGNFDKEERKICKWWLAHQNGRKKNLLF